MGYKSLKTHSKLEIFYEETRWTVRNPSRSSSLVLNNPHFFCVHYRLFGRFLLVRDFLEFENNFAHIALNHAKNFKPCASSCLFAVVLKSN